MAGEMNVSDMEECKSVTIHGTFVGGVSPVKKSRNRSDMQYFKTSRSYVPWPL